MPDRHYTIQVVNPDGDTMTVLVPENQVEYFKGGTGEPFSTAAWLAYTDIWTRVK